MTWDGNERRGSSHIGEDIAVIKERLFALDKRINGTIGSIEKHLEESVKFRDLIQKHDQIITDICNLKRWWYGAIGTIVVTILGVAIVWGALLWRVDRLEKLHPIGKVLVSEEKIK
jgi:enoyl reductase-like protein